MQASRITFLTATVNIAEYEVEFSWLRMIQFCIYHLLWFALGPLALTLLIPLEGVAMCQNLAFFPSKLPFFFAAAMQWISLQGILLFYFIT